MDVFPLNKILQVFIKVGRQTGTWGASRQQSVRSFHKVTRLKNYTFKIQVKVIEKRIEFFKQIKATSNTTTFPGKGFQRSSVHLRKKQLTDTSSKMF